MQVVVFGGRHYSCPVSLPETKLKKLRIDVTPLQTPGIMHRGIGRYAQSLFRALDSLPERPTMTLFDPFTGIEVPFTPDYQPTPAPLSLSETHWGMWKRSWLQAWGHQSQPAPSDCPTLFLCSDALPHWMPPKSVVIVLDLIPACWPPWASQRKLGGMRDAWTGFQRRGPVEYIACSEHTRQDALRVWKIKPEQIVAIPHLLSVSEIPAEISPRIEAMRSDGLPYLVFLGAREPRKGIGPFLKHWEETSPQGVKLVVAGPARGFDPDLEERLQRLIQGGSVASCFDLTEVEKASLLSEAAVMLFPSRYEGYGLPIAEAMACGTPSVSFDNSSLPEAAGPHGVLVPDGDYEALLQTAVDLAKNPREAQARGQAGKAWVKSLDQAEVARRFLAVCAKTL